MLKAQLFQTRRKNSPQRKCLFFSDNSCFPSLWFHEMRQSFMSLLLLVVSIWSIKIDTIWFLIFEKECLCPFLFLILDMGKLGILILQFKEISFKSSYRTWQSTFFKEPHDWKFWGNICLLMLDYGVIHLLCR